MHEFENYLMNKEDSGVSPSELRHMGKFRLAPRRPGVSDVKIRAGIS